MLSHAMQLERDGRVLLLFGGTVVDTFRASGQDAVKDMLLQLLSAQVNPAKDGNLYA